MKRVLILYASKGGSTAEVANYIAIVLREADIKTDVVYVDHFTGQVQDYDALIIGSPIYKGIWMTNLWRILRQIQSKLNKMPIWGFSLCMRALEPGGEEYARAHYLPPNIFDNLNLQDYRFFAGRLTNLTISQKTEFYETYDGIEGRREGDYRDWNAIHAWTQKIATIFAPVTTQ